MSKVTSESGKTEIRTVLNIAAKLWASCLLNPCRCDKAVIRLPFAGPLPAAVWLFRAAAVLGAGAGLEAPPVTFNTELLGELEAGCTAPDQGEV